MDHTNEGEDAGQGPPSYEAGPLVEAQNNITHTAQVGNHAI